MRVSRIGEARWTEGRAGMEYRDLGLAGRFIASHIRFAAGGPVPDYVHFHAIDFQLIHCARGWVRLAYEGLAAPFVMNAGDCVLQPPGIRHRVLDSSPGLEVVEVASPAGYQTAADQAHEMPPPAPRELEQKFLWHRSAEADWRPWRGFEVRETGAAEASGGRVAARVVRARGAAEANDLGHGGDLYLGFVLAGAVTLRCQGDQPLVAGDSFTIPAAQRFGLAARDLELLEVVAPASIGD
jgi:quercetin dioxygenase-like cupin family protein